VKASTRGTSGARLPLMLLRGFVVLIAGVVVWLTLSSPDPVVTAETPTDKKSAAAEQKPIANPGSEPGSDPGSDPKDNASKPAPDTAEDAKPPAHGNDGDQQQPTLRGNATPAPTPSKPPAQTATAPSQVAPQAAPRAKTPENSITPKQPGPAAAMRTVMPKKLPRVAPDAPLLPSPDPALLQMTALGPLPSVGDDGRLPRQVYAKPFNTADERPRIAIVVTGLGLSAAATESAIQGLPGSVTLAFAPYSPRLNEWIRLARAAGHEVLINVPMEPTNYPAYDPGPQTLLTTLNAEGNLDRLLWSLSRGTGYVGVVDFLGSQFTTSRDHMTPVLDAIHRRGLLYLDSNGSPRSVSAAVAAKLKMVSAKATLTLDERASRTEIDRRFAELEQRAKRENRAIGIASPYPVSLERIATWVRQLEARGIAIAPVSALTQTPAPARAAQ
jgi:polysaccharide deacetylase 2 family uncharacterized protein YibQ